VRNAHLNEILFEKTIESQIAGQLKDRNIIREQEYLFDIPSLQCILNPNAQRDTAMKKMICLAGFGDNSSMFTPLLSTSLCTDIEIIPFDMPGFGAPAFVNQLTTLDALAKVVDEKARTCGASIILAHSVASIIASLAARIADSPITTILSLEGNLTAEDAYYSGTAANYESPNEFRLAFLSRLAEMAKNQSTIVRYRAIVETADPQALWELGRDAHRFSQEIVAGDFLIQSAKVVYLYNIENVPSASQEWLKTNDIPQVEMKHATHWPSFDNPAMLAEKLKELFPCIK